MGINFSSILYYLLKNKCDILNCLKKYQNSKHFHDVNYATRMIYSLFGLKL